MSKARAAAGYGGDTVPPTAPAPRPPGPPSPPPAAAAAASPASARAYVLDAVHADLARLSLTQLQGEVRRLDARKAAATWRIARLLATGERPRKRCTVAECGKHAQRGGLCGTHMPEPPPPKMCRHAGCARHAQRKGVCYSHGATYRLCTVEGCTNKIQQGGLCFRHGAKKRKHSEATGTPVLQGDL